MPNLKSQLIRLGEEHPELQEDLRPIIASIPKVAASDKEKAKPITGSLMLSPLADVTWKELVYAINNLRNTYQKYHGSSRPNKNTRQLVIDAQEAISVLKDIQKG